MRIKDLKNKRSEDIMKKCIEESKVANMVIREFKIY